MTIEYEMTPSGRLILDQGSQDAVIAMDPWSRHHAYHLICRDKYRETAGAVDPQPETDMAKNGFQVLPGLLTADQVSQVRAMMDDRIGGREERPVKFEDWAQPLPWNMARIHSVRQVLASAFDGPLSQVIEAYFESYFRLLSVTVTRAHPAPAKNSFLWHRDIEPPQQTHLMIYLTDSSPETGGTSFLNLADSRISAENGYSFKNFEERSASLESIEQKAGKSFEVHRPALKAGDGVLFAAPRILHRGELPTKGVRDAITVLMLPSPVPWQEFLAGSPGRVFVTEHPASAFIEPFGDGMLEKTGMLTPPNWASLGEFFPPDSP
ncbi:MAG: hypothetical protein CMM77_11810 [Rhodospirillaceae bacterium]|nr:hypothetical protein [Rhodospirillaceae bacterium]